MGSKRLTDLSSSILDRHRKLLACFDRAHVPIPMKPLMVSKLNTVAQVAFAALVLAALGFGFNSTPYDLILMGFVTVFTLVSVSLYLVEWVRHMSTIETS